MTQFGAFLAVSALVIMTPGQDTALTVRNALAGGRRTGVFTAVGVAAGQAIWSLAASGGVAALLIASAPAFVAIKLAGAAYLMFLGAQAAYAALRGQPVGPVAGAEVMNRLTPTAALRQGILSNLGNPKMMVFFTSLLPQFVPGETATFAGLFVLGLVFCALTLVWLTGYAVIVARVGDVLRRAMIRRVLEGMTGAFLIALGLRLATERG